MKAAVFMSALLFVQATSAGAAEADAPPFERVSVADLNLDSPEGRATLDLRIVAAAKKVCSGRETSVLRPEQSLAQCRAAAVSRANAKRDRILAMRRAAEFSLATAQPSK
jgi:UrcA family protein